MRIKDNISLRAVGNEHIMVTESDKGLDFSRIISLNESATYLAHAVCGKSFTEQDWVDLIMERYEVQEEVARKDVRELVRVLLENGVIVED